MSDEIRSRYRASVEEAGAIRLDMRDIFVTPDEAIGLRHLSDSMAKQQGTRVNVSMFQDTARTLCMIIERSLNSTRQA